MRQCILFFFIFFVISNVYSQNETRKVLFEVYYQKNKPKPALNLVLNTEADELYYGTQTDLKGKAEMNLKNIDQEVEMLEIDFYAIVLIPKEADLIKVNIDKKKIVFYSKGRVLKKEKLQI